MSGVDVELFQFGWMDSVSVVWLGVEDDDDMKCLTYLGTVENTKNSQSTKLQHEAFGHKQL